MEIYTPEQAAKILQVNVQTLRKWLRKGELTGANTSAGWRLTPADIEAFLERQRERKNS
jgi:excisionase family DNA binding protein